MSTMKYDFIDNLLLQRLKRKLKYHNIPILDYSLFSLPSPSHTTKMNNQMEMWQERISTTNKGNTVFDVFFRKITVSEYFLVNNFVILSLLESRLSYIFKYRMTQKWQDIYGIVYKVINMNRKSRSKRVGNGCAISIWNENCNK